MTAGRRNDKGDPDADGNLAEKELDDLSCEQKLGCFCCLFFTVKICGRPKLRGFFVFQMINDHYFTERGPFLANVTVFWQDPM